MLRAGLIGLMLFLIELPLAAENSLSQFEGILGGPVGQIKNLNGYAKAFIPYNPVIVEIGAFEGEGTLQLAQTYHYGKIFAFEPDPQAYSILAEKTQPFKNVSTFNLAVNTFNGSASLWGNAPWSSLLHLEEDENHCTVPCVVLDDWCEGQQIPSIDFLRLDAGGLEWQILQSSPKMLDKVIVIVIKTHLFPSRQSILSFWLLRRLLEDRGFELLSHWFLEGKEGEATFVRKYMYDSIFR